MDPRLLIDGLILYLSLLVLLTLHEFGHAWTASKCGDDTARLQGRVSLNPLAHIDLIGTVIIPLLAILLPGGFFIGWAKPVPVDPHNLRNPRTDDLLVTLAGPGMNLVVAVILVGLARVGLLAHSHPMMEICFKMAHLSLLLCIFNLLPIPPLDGSQVLRNLIGMSHEAYYQISRYGFIVLIVLLQIPVIPNTVAVVTQKSFGMIGGWFGMELGY